MKKNREPPCYTVFREFFGYKDERKVNKQNKDHIKYWPGKQKATYP